MVNNTALLAHNATGALQSSSTAIIQELLTEMGELQKTVTRLETMVKERDAKIAELEAAPKGTP